MSGVARRFGSFGAGIGIQHAGRRAILAREKFVEQLVGKRRLLPYFATPQQLRDHGDPHLPYDCVSRSTRPPIPGNYSHSCLIDISVLVRPFWLTNHEFHFTLLTPIIGKHLNYQKSTESEFWSHPTFSRFINYHFHKLYKLLKL